ncbi:hypothetical protein QQS21_012048 [Conoideocrella luteorostrata]|uniref:Peptidase A1 domain-containing protein n=1 Tax=Conoideocrella luteorostrata TaxID=1105319 RepID=A0AAJ0CCZ6_9HYPO|nr:hypothetical protein QQS21_012048 [Conoideocrella luteorostrata]
MKATYLMLRVSGPLLILSGQVTAQAAANLEVSQIKKVTDATQGGFRPFMEFSVAGQVMMGLLDTGSSDLTVPRTGSAFCKSAGQQCDGTTTGFKTGSFDPGNTGNLAKDLNVPLKATFTGGAGFTGRFIEALLQVVPNGISVPVQMGLVEGGGVPAGEVSFPVIGVGPVQGESTKKNYPNIPARFKQENSTKVNAFGLYLGDFRKYMQIFARLALFLLFQSLPRMSHFMSRPQLGLTTCLGSPDNGTLIWGGFDAAKIEGELKAAPLLRTQDNALPSYVVDFSSVRLQSAKASQSAQGQGRTTGRTKALFEADDSLPWSGQFRQRTSSSTGRSRVRAGSYEHLRLRVSKRDILRRQRDGNLLTNDAPPVALLDTGAPSLVLPLRTIESLGKSLGGRPGPQGEFLVDCARVSGMELVFGMNKDAIQVRVPLDSIMAAPEKGRGPSGGPGNDNSQRGDAQSFGGNTKGSYRNNNGGNDRGGNDGAGNDRGGNDGAGNDRGGNNRGANDRAGNGRAGNGGTLGTGGSGNTCKLELDPVEGDSPPVLGAPAMQHMYIVFDNDSEVLMIAQARPNEARSDVRPYVPSGRK